MPVKQLATIKGQLYEIIKSSPVLVSKTRHGQAKYWQGHIVRYESLFHLTSSYWHETTTGAETKRSFAVPYEVKPKNVGRSNETSESEQAELEFASMVKKQQDKGYTEEGTISKVLPLPMLAQKFGERAHYISWPAYVQPKLDGNRMLFDGTKAWSRGGKDMIRECVEHLFFDTKGHIIDGELILPDNVLLQSTAKAIKKFRHDVSPNLTYQVYDVVDESLTFEERHTLLRQLVKNAPKNVVLVETVKVQDEADVFLAHTKFTKAGYEGTMVRNVGGKYTVGQRSNDLQKYKDFEDAEFKIIGVQEGEGSEKGLAIFKCVTKEGKEFDCRPEGDYESRAQLWKNRKEHIGKWLTVRFKGLTAEKKPLYPVGVVIREDGD